MDLHRLLILIVISFCIVSILAPSIPAYAKTPPEDGGNNPPPPNPPPPSEPDGNNNPPPGGGDGD